MNATRFAPRRAPAFGERLLGVSGRWFPPGDEEGCE
jgi:hypothetical protein